MFWRVCGTLYFLTLATKYLHLTDFPQPRHSCVKRWGSTSLPMETWWALGTFLRDKVQQGWHCVASEWVSAQSFNRVQLFETPWTVARQAPLSMEFSRQRYWSRLPCPSPGVFPTQGSNRGLTYYRRANGLKNLGEPSLVVKWLRICLPMQRTWVQSLVEVLRSHMPWSNYWAHTHN